MITVAPARERGLKYQGNVDKYEQSCRSREGAWIEMTVFLSCDTLAGGRSREGAWIEITPLPL